MNATTNGNIAELVSLERAISGVEKESIRSRWDFARRFLELLPRAEYGVNAQTQCREYRDAVMSATGVKKSELDHRVKLWRTFPTEDEIAHASMEYPNWTTLRAQALYRKKRTAPRLTPRQMLDEQRKMLLASMVPIEELLEQLNGVETFPAEIPAGGGKITISVHPEKRSLVWEYVRDDDTSMDINMTLEENPENMLASV